MLAARRFPPYATLPEMNGSYRLDALGTWRDQIAALDAEYLATGREMAEQRDNPITGFCPSCGGAGTETGRMKAALLLSVWTPLKTAWDTYRDGHDSWYEAPWTGTDIKAFRQRLREFRDAAEKIGFVFIGPDPVTPPESDFFGLGRTIRYAIVGGVLIAGLVVLYKVAPRGK